VTPIAPERPHRDASLSIRDVLELPVVRQGLPQLLSGADALERGVRWTHIIEAADVRDVLKGDELVLSTGAGIAGDAKAQRAFVRQLVEEHAAALVIELGTVYRSELPRPLVAQARDSGLPLIALRRRVRFVEITEAVHGSLIERQVLLLREADEIQDEFLSLLLQGGGVRDILRALARRVANPVVFENAARQLVAHATHCAKEDVALSAWESYASGSDAGGGAPGVLDAEVQTLGRVTGRLVALEVDGPFDRYAQLALDRAATAVSLELRRRHYEDHLQSQSRGLFLADLARGALEEDDAARRAVAQGFTRRPGPMLPVVLTFRSGRWQSLGATMERAWTALLPTLKQAATGHSRAVLTGPADPDLLAILDVEGRDVDGAYLDSLAAAFRRALERRGLTAEDVTLAFGPCGESWGTLGRGLETTLNAAGVARTLAPSGWHDARRSSVNDFLFSICSSPELQHFIDRQLGPLLDDERGRNRGLLSTLETYLETGGRKSEAARALHLERQSLYARLKRIEKVLGVALDDQDVFLSLHLACRARRLLGELGGRDWA
jgi:purine catabolism regulator